MAARVVQRVAQQDDFENFPLMHAMGANAAGQVASTVAGGAARLWRALAVARRALARHASPGLGARPLAAESSRPRLVRP